MEVTRRDDGLRLTAPTTCSATDFSTFVLVALVLLVTLAVGGAFLATHHGVGRLFSAITAIDEVPWYRAALIIGVILGWLLALVAMAAIPLEMLLGREVVTITPTHLLIRRSIGPLARTVHLPVADIVAVRDVEPPRSWRFRAMHYRPMWTGAHGRIEVELRTGRRVRFGTLDVGTNLRIFRGAVNRELSIVMGPRAAAPAIAEPVVPGVVAAK